MSFQRTPNISNADVYKIIAYFSPAVNYTKYAIFKFSNNTSEQHFFARLKIRESGAVFSTGSDYIIRIYPSYTVFYTNHFKLNYCVKFDNLF